MSRRDGIPWGKEEAGRGMGLKMRDFVSLLHLYYPIPTPALPLKGRE